MRTSILSVVSILSLSSAVACSGAPENLPALGADGGPSPSGTSSNGSNDNGSEAGARDPGKQAEPPAPPPKADQVTEAFGVFVARNGAAQNPGTRKSPFLSIQDAIAKAKAEKKRVFVCEGTYEEALDLENGVSIVGGLDCSADEWKLTEKKSVLTSPSSPAIRATSITQPTRIDNFAVSAPNATTASGSSIGVWAVDSNALTFAKSTIEAGSAMKGDDGTEGMQLRLEVTQAATFGRNFGSTLYTDTIQHEFGGHGATGLCYDPGNLPFSRMAGGTGGTTGIYQRSDSSASWQVLSAPMPPTDFAPNAPSVSGTNGTSAAAPSLDGDDYTPSDGTAGTSGTVGKSGKGGVGRAPFGTTATGRFYGQAGPGGGIGGCPGIAGTAGKGGGASLAALAIRSPLRFDGVTLTSRAGGAGGCGTFGSNATAGAPGADDASGATAPIYKSSTPEPGGPAGISGNGAGGPSIGVAYRGMAPILERTTTTVGAAGAGVEARSQGAKTIPASPAGASEGVKEL